MGLSTATGHIKYVFTQAAPGPSGIGEVEGSLWYNTDTNALYSYDGLAWNILGETSSGGNLYVDVMFPDNVTAGTWATTFNDTFFNNTNFYNSTGAQNDQCEFSVYLPAGTYTLTFTHRKSASFGIAKIYIDADLVASQDMYAGGDSGNNRHTTTGITVASDGLKELKILCNTKNGSASNYYVGFHTMSLHRTA